MTEHPRLPRPVVGIVGLALAIILILLSGCGMEQRPEVEAARCPEPASASSSLTPPPRQSPPSWRPWRSGVWTGGKITAGQAEAFGRWRGAPVETATAYPSYETWAQICRSTWLWENFSGFSGRLVLGLPLLPNEGTDQLPAVAAGRFDDVWRSLASQLVANGHGDSFVRVGLEANGTWARWGARQASAADFRNAYRRVVTVMRPLAPHLSFVFDISCGSPLKGAEDRRLAALTDLYPGDDVVDVVGCDHYDHWSLVSRNDTEWQRALAPPNAPGLADVAAFAASHGKRFAVPEWGVVGPQAEGGGDNPFFIRAMHTFLRANAGNLAFENYFDEPADYLRSSLQDGGGNPRAAAVYRELW